MASETLLKLGEGEVVRVVGPLRLRVEDGEVLLVGASYGKGSEVIVPSMRSYGVLSLKETVLRVFLGEGARIEKPLEGEEVVQEWLKVAETIWRDRESTPEKKLKIMIIGPVESGKTTLAAFVSNYITQRGGSVCLIELDVGQEDLCVPGTISLTRVTNTFVWQRGLQQIAFRYVGCITPSYCRSDIVAGAYDLLRSRHVEGCDAVVVNTDGWVDGEAAIEFKHELVRWIRPTHIILLGRDTYARFGPALSPLVKALEAPTPGKVRERSREERRYLRQQAYRKYFEGSPIRRLSLREVAKIKCCVLGGEEVDFSQYADLITSLGIEPSDVVLLTRYGNTLNIVTGKRPRTMEAGILTGKGINLVDAESLKGMMVSLIGERMEEVGLGIVEGLRREGSDVIMLLRTPYRGEIVGIICGRIRLNPDFSDSGRVSRCAI